jgi:hypothetical protein
MMGIAPIPQAKKWTDREVLENIGTTTRMNRARQAFRNWSAKIEQAQSQRKPIGPIEVRRMEFEAVEAYNAP